MHYSHNYDIESLNEYYGSLDAVDFNSHMRINETAIFNNEYVFSEANVVDSLVKTVKKIIDSTIGSIKKSKSASIGADSPILSKDKKGNDIYFGINMAEFNAIPSLPSLRIKYKKKFNYYANTTLNDLYRAANQCEAIFSTVFMQFNNPYNKESVYKILDTANQELYKALSFLDVSKTDPTKNLEAKIKKHVLPEEYPSEYLNDDDKVGLPRSLRWLAQGVMYAGGYERLIEEMERDKKAFENNVSKFYKGDVDEKVMKDVVKTLSNVGNAEAILVAEGTKYERQYRDQIIEMATLVMNKAYPKG